MRRQVSHVGLALTWVALVSAMIATAARAEAQQADAENHAATASPVPGDAHDASPSDGAPAPDPQADAARSSKADLLIASITIFVLAIFIGFEVITKVPPTLHTPLMSGSNAISGITIVGALIVAGHAGGAVSGLGFLAVVLAMINVVGGFVVTHRMLAMFKRR